MTPPPARGVRARLGLVAAILAFVVVLPACREDARLHERELAYHRLEELCRQTDDLKKSIERVDFYLGQESNPNHTAYRYAAGAADILTRLEQYKTLDREHVALLTEMRPYLDEVHDLLRAAQSASDRVTAMRDEKIGRAEGRLEMLLRDATEEAIRSGDLTAATVGAKVQFHLTKFRLHFCDLEIEDRRSLLEFMRRLLDALLAGELDRSNLGRWPELRQKSDPAAPARRQAGLMPKVREAFVALEEDYLHWAALADAEQRARTAAVIVVARLQSLSAKLHENAALLRVRCAVGKPDATP